MTPRALNAGDPPAAVVDTDTTLPPAVRQALLGLNNSRAALRKELMPAPQHQGRQPGAGLARLWWRRLRQWPAGRVAGELAQQWWHRHPWRPLGDTLIGEVRGLVSPLVARHPWLAVGAAAAAGACLVAAKPWRWRWVDQQVRRAPNAATGWVMAQLTSAPAQAALAGVLALVARNLHATDRTATTPQPAAAGPEPAADAARAPASAGSAGHAGG